MIVYIAGPITGKKDYKEAFEKAEQMLRNEGVKLINPAKLPDDLPYKAYMPICLAMIDISDEVYMLSDWRNSRGARLERDYAIATGKTVRFQEGD